MSNNMGIKKSLSYILSSHGEDPDFSERDDLRDILSSNLPNCNKLNVNQPQELTVKPTHIIHRGITESLCNLQLDNLSRLKDSTRKLLYLLEEIRSKTRSKNIDASETPKLLNLVKPIPISSALPSVTDLLGAHSLKHLERQTDALDSIIVQEDDDCSIYKRLTRKCQCLNRVDYNDFMIHFNEETKFFTNTIGELIKNMRILKKFLYMNGEYAKRSLQFLNEGFTQSTYTEKVEIIQGCAYADICNLFEEFSIAIVYISWPCKYENYGDAITQGLTARFLHKLVQLEEGRRYLNLSTKITNDLKKIIRKSASKLEYDTLETLNIVLNVLQPTLYNNVSATYYSKPVDEDYLGSRTINILSQNRKQMTLEEVFAHLELLNNYSAKEKGKIELTSYLPLLTTLFRNMLMEYNNSAMNIIITSILNNIVAKNLPKGKDADLPKTVVIADTATETITMKNEANQIPVRKGQSKKHGSHNKSKSKMGLGVSPNKFRTMSSSRKTFNWESSFMSQPKKIDNNHLRSSIIVVPMERY